MVAIIVNNNITRAHPVLGVSLPRGLSPSWRGSALPEGFSTSYHHETFLVSGTLSLSLSHSLTHPLCFLSGETQFPSEHGESMNATLGVRGWGWGEGAYTLCNPHLRYAAGLNVVAQDEISFLRRSNRDDTKTHTRSL